MKQEPLPRSVEKRLFGFYGQGSPNSPVRCVVTDGDYTWHHLDGDHHNHALANIVPLSSRLNSELGGLERRNRKSPPWVDPQLHPDSLLNRADVTFRLWRVAEAFGCAHLAFFTGINPHSILDASRRLSAMRRALYYVRHKFNKEMIEYIVQNEFLPFLHRCASEIESAERELTLQEICALLGEEGESEFAAELSDLLAPDRRMTGEQKASLLRRKGQSLGLAGRNTRRVKKLLDESGEFAGEDLNQLASRVNTQAFLALSEPSKPQLREAFEKIFPLFAGLLKKHERERLVAMTPSNAAAVALHEAIFESIFRPRGWESRRDRAVMLAGDLFKTAGTDLWLLRPGYWDTVLQSIREYGGEPGGLDCLIEQKREALSPTVVRQLRKAVKLLRS